MNMVKIDVVDTGAPKGGPFSPGLKVGDLLFVSGQGPIDPKTKAMGSTIEEQTLTTLNNLKEKGRAITYRFCEELQQVTITFKITKNAMLL